MSLMETLIQGKTFAGLRISGARSVRSEAGAAGRKRQGRQGCQTLAYRRYPHETCIFASVQLCIRT
jgi:hypothetical protein